MYNVLNMSLKEALQRFLTRKDETKSNNILVGKHLKSNVHIWLSDLWMEILD